MKGLFYLVAFILFVVIILPVMVIRGCVQREIPHETYDVKVYVVSDGRIVVMGLEDYVKGVVAAEMPAHFHIEAMKAQALAARTYAVKRMKQWGGSGCSLHPGADVCTDPAHCAAWLSREELAAKWGPLAFLAYYRKVERAVNETRGLVITYNDKLIDPVFHSTSGGKTENSEDVWANRVPYLRSVTSKYEEHSPKFISTRVILREDFIKTLKDKYPEIKLSDKKPLESQLQVIEESVGGKIKTLKIGGVTIKGTEFRSLFGLNSSNFSLTDHGETVRITTIGYGHGVGMSQYGADGMAKMGHNFKSIITHYYTGVKIVDISSLTSK